MLTKGMSIREAVRKSCTRELGIDDVSNLALRASTRATLESIRKELKDVSAEIGLPIFHMRVIKHHLHSLLTIKAWKLSSILTRARYIHMLATRERAWVTKPIWLEDITSGLARMSAMDQATQAFPISKELLTALLQSLLLNGQLEMRAFLALAWLLAGRIGEVLVIPRAHLRCGQLPVSIKFTYMKGVYGHQEKALPAGSLCDIVCAWARHLDLLFPHRKRLFHLSRAKVMLVLKSFDQRLTGHSFRRGALQHADQQGVAGADLQALSGHKTQQVLQRYLGRASSERRAAMLRVGATLQL
jgi:integrase